MRAGMASIASETGKRESVYSDSDKKEITSNTTASESTKAGDDAKKDVEAGEVPQHYSFPRRVGR